MEGQIEQPTAKYGKRPLWQWIVFYLIIGGIIYALIYYFILAKRGSTNVYQVNNAPTNVPLSEQIFPTTAPASSSPEQSQNRITLNSNGFTPSTLTIKAGGTVVWTNESGKVATINSDPHPTHGDYAPLNLGNFLSGGTLSLTFSTPGTYGYHNHLNPSQTGTIVVE